MEDPIRSSRTRELGGYRLADLRRSGPAQRASSGARKIADFRDKVRSSQKGMADYPADMNELLASKIVTHAALQAPQVGSAKDKDTGVSLSINAGGHLRCEKTSSADSGWQLRSEIHAHGSHPSE